MIGDTANSPPPLFFKNARIVDPSRDIDEHGGAIVANGRIVGTGGSAATAEPPEGAEIIDCHGAVIAPGLIDMRVLVGEPGGEHRETLASAGQAAAAGGVTTIVTMPDTDPVIDDAALVDFITRRARDTASVRVLPAAALTESLAGKENHRIRPPHRSWCGRPQRRPQQCDERAFDAAGAVLCS